MMTTTENNTDGARNPFAASKIGNFGKYSRTNQSWEEVFSGEYECHLTSPPATVLDIGANEGAFSAWASERWPGAKIKAYEPAAPNVDLFLRNLGGNPNIEFYGCAVGDLPGRMRLYGPLHNSGEWSCFDIGEQDKGTWIDVPVVAANTLVSAEFVKIDCEGCELMILEGLDLSATKALVVEYHRGIYREKIAEICAGAGLQLFQHSALTANTGTLKFAGAGAVRASQTPTPIPDEMRLAGNTADGKLIGLTAGDIRNEHYDPRLRGMKLFIGVPSAHPSLHFTQCLLQLQKEKPLPLELHFSSGDGVARARNALTAAFLRGDCTHLLWWDDDLTAGRHHIIALLLANQPVVGGFYPMKKEGPLEWVVNSLPGDPGPVGCLQPLKYAGTGFLMIQRSVFEKMMVAYPELEFCEDYGTRSKAFDFWSMGVYRDGIGNALMAAQVLLRYFHGTRKEITGGDAEFMATLERLAAQLMTSPVGRYLSEDWFFCQRWLDMGGQVFNHCNVVLKHVGSAIYPLKTQEAEISNPRGKIPAEGAKGRETFNVQRPTSNAELETANNVVDGEMVPGVRRQSKIESPGPKIF